MITSPSPGRRDALPGASWATLEPPGATLSPHDTAYLEARAVTVAVARAAGVRTARKPAEIPPAFSPFQRRRTPTLVAPHLSPDGVSAGWQKRDLRPGRDKSGELIKWMSPKGARMVLSVHPWTANEARHGTGRLWLLEGVTRLLAVTDRGEVGASYAGCNAWKQHGEPLRCFDYVNLSGRLVLDVPDADYRTNESVQDALAERVRFLESRGARVLVVSVPPVNDDEHAGLDDYLAAGGDLEALAASAEPFTPCDVGRTRLKRDEILRAFIPAKRREIEELTVPTNQAASGVKLARWMLEAPTPSHGKRRERGVEIHPSYPQMAEAVCIGSFQTVSNALEWLQEVGVLEIKRAPRGSRLASQYLLLYPWEGGSVKSVNIEEQGVAGEEGQEQGGERETREEIPFSQRDSSLRLHSTRAAVKGAARPEKVPALRSSKLVHTYIPKKGQPRGEVVHSDYFRRYGSKREEIIRRVIGCGGEDEEALCEKYGSASSRLRDFRRTWLRPMLEDGVLVRQGSTILPASDWFGALERVRARGHEDEDNRKQSEKYAERRRNYRARLEGEKRGKVPQPEPTPKLAGPEAVRENVAVAEKRDHAARVEEQRRKVGTTPATFLADALQDASGFGWRELRALWMAKGGKPEDLRRAVKDPYRFNREGGKGALYVERRTGGPVTVAGPDREPAPVAVLREPENLTKPHISPAAPIPPNLKKPETESPAGDWRSHPLACECDECLAPMPVRYARAWSGA